MSNHNKFILLPVADILSDAVTAAAGLVDGIETYPVLDYVMQSVFLKMTGAQEQKMKCICWELATIDYEYRYDRYSKNTLGECSSFDEKKKVYDDLVKQIKRFDSKFDRLQIDRKVIFIETVTELREIFSGTNLKVWAGQNYIEFETIINEIINLCLVKITDNGNLFWYDCSNCSELDKKNKSYKCNNRMNLTGMYEMLYQHRNRCAHNTLSYQQNLPTLKTLGGDNHRFDNYFLHFTLLILIDKIFILLYKKYLEAIDG